MSHTSGGWEVQDHLLAGNGAGAGRVVVGARLPAPKMVPAAPSVEDEHMEEGSKANRLTLVTPSFLDGLIHSPLKEPIP